jgi:hypothetical protein
VLDTVHVLGQDIYIQYLTGHLYTMGHLYSLYRHNNTL